VEIARTACCITFQDPGGGSVYIVDIQARTISIGGESFAITNLRWDAQACPVALPSPERGGGVGATLPSA
jgi:hypothetical protein